MLDPNGKLSITLSYGKLLSRSLKIAYNLLNKIGLNNKAGECQIHYAARSGDLATMEMLLDRGAEVNTRWAGIGGGRVT